jgi:type IV secretory pathway VirD2 relaxase
MSDLLRSDLWMRPHPLGMRGERHPHGPTFWWTGLGKRGARASRHAGRLNTQLGRRGAITTGQPRAYMQRSVVKVSYSRNTKSASWAAHGRYLARDGAQRQGEKGLGFNAERDDLDLAKLVGGWQKAGDERLFRLIVSPENGAQLDLREHARELVAQMERDLNTKLEWAAIDHHNTDNPHLHVLIRGRDDQGRALSIDRGYIQSGIRMRSAEIASQELGLRAERDVLKARGAAVRREQFTEIDRELIRRAGEKHIVSFDGRQPRGEAARERRSQEMARLKFLSRMGLAQKIDSTSWQLAPALERTLRERQLSIDIIKSRARHREQMLDKRAPLAVTKLAPGQELTGRVVGTGLENEARDRRYLMLEAADGKLHYLHQTPAIIRARGERKIGLGEVVTLEAREFQKDGRRVNYLRVEQHGELRSMRTDSQIGNRLDLEALKTIERDGRIETRGWRGFAGKWRQAMEDRLPVLEQAGLIVRHHSARRDYFVPAGAEQKLRAEIAAREQREQRRQQHGKERTR